MKRKTLILPFLDKEFQELIGAPSQIVEKYTKLAFIISDTVIASPSFFIESGITRNTILLSHEFIGTEHLLLSMREKSYEEFLIKKQDQYSSVREHYEEYYTDSSMVPLLIKPRNRTHSIGDTIAKKWTNSFSDNESFNLYHITSLYTNDSTRSDILHALQQVPHLIGDSPFVWENVLDIMNDLEPKWKASAAVKEVRMLLLKIYFDSLAEEDDLVSSFTDFPWAALSDDTLENKMVPLRPLDIFFGQAGIIKVFETLTVYDIIELANSDECLYFRENYFNLLESVETDDLLNQLNEQHKVEKDFKKSLAIYNSNKRNIWRLFTKFIKGYFSVSRKIAIKEAFIKTPLIDFTLYIKNNFKELNATPKIIYMSKTDFNINSVGQLNSVSGDNNNVNINQHTLDSIDLKTILPELLKIQDGLEHSNIQDRQEKIEEIKVIEAAIEEGDQNRAKKMLRGAGKWLLDFATKFGSSYLVDLLRN